MVDGPAKSGLTLPSTINRQPSTIIIADRSSVRLNPEAITTDVAEFQAALQAAQRTGGGTGQIELLAQAVERYQGELLPGHFEDWVLQERQWLGEQYFAALGQLLAHLERAGEWERALEFARQGVRVDPLREEVHYDLIRLLAAAGHREAALGQYGELARLMEEQLGAEPSPEVQAFAAEIRSQVQSADRTRPKFACPPAAAAAPLGNLPFRLTRFFGRKPEIARLRALLQSKGTRLVTLTGPGGSGKTRLALETVGRLRKVWPGGIWFVPLQDLADPQLIPATVLDALRAPRAAQVEPLEQLVTALSDQARLLVLDNFEHLVNEGTSLVRTLLERVAPLTVLVTSRQRLGLPGERQFPVPPLPIPAEGVGCGVWGVGSDRGEPAVAAPYTLHPTPYTLMQCPSVRLFVDRARAVRPEFQVTAANAAAVAGLCTRLEGLPLALELAAARIGVLTPEQMLGWLESTLPSGGTRFEFLVSRERLADRRHQSLRAALDGSFQLLSSELQRFFARLSVFQGGWTLAAAEAVCVEPGALGYLEQLQECSLVLAEEGAVGQGSGARGEGSGRPPEFVPELTPDPRPLTPGAEIRFRLLETLREYGAEQLGAEERALLRRQHAGYFAALAEEAEPKLRSAEQLTWLDRLEEEHNNLRAALAWCQEAGDRAETGLQMAGALWLFWHIRGHWAEGRGWLETALTRAGASAHTLARARALLGASQLAHFQRDHERTQVLRAESLSVARELGDPRSTAMALLGLGSHPLRHFGAHARKTVLDECLPIGRTLGDRWIIARSLLTLGWDAHERGDRTAARALGEESLAAGRELGDGDCLCLSFIGMAYWAYVGGEFAAARAFHEGCLACARRIGHQWAIAGSLINLGEVARCQGDYEAATAFYNECIPTYRAMGEIAFASLLSNFGYAALGQGDYRRAAALFGQGMKLAQAKENWSGVIFCLRGLAGVATAAGPNPEGAHRAARLLGAAEDVPGVDVDLSRDPADRADYDRIVAATRAALTAEAFAAAWAEGRATSLESAIALALAELSEAIMS
jgi:predicted ATPase